MIEAAKPTQWVVITGAPSSGKTSVIDVLARRGYATVKEAARAFIQEGLNDGQSLQQLRGNNVSLQDHILSLALQWDRGLDADQLVFLDRGLPDSISYLRQAGLDTAKAEKASALYHYRAVFIFDMLPIKNDGVRTEDQMTAASLDRLLEEDYSRLGYNPIRVPVLPIEERADFIISHLNFQKA